MARAVTVVLVFLVCVAGHMSLFDTANFPLVAWYYFLAVSSGYATLMLSELQRRVDEREADVGRRVDALVAERSEMSRVAMRALEDVNRRRVEVNTLKRNYRVPDLRLLDSNVLPFENVAQMPAPYDYRDYVKYVDSSGRRARKPWLK